MTVRSLSQMFNPGTIGASADCDTCGGKGGKPKVTRVALENMAKINRGVRMAGATAEESLQVAKEVGKVLAKAAPIPRGRKKKEAEPTEEQAEPTETLEND